MTCENANDADNYANDADNHADYADNYANDASILTIAPTISADR